ncbi:hypothetical protein THOG05_50036 [Vibrio rotiferianus]|nr:hypothetical protein THOG05_50036 [Vibrio rotiferianus]
MTRITKITHCRPALLSYRHNKAMIDYPMILKTVSLNALKIFPIAESIQFIVKQLILISILRSKRYTGSANNR